MQSIEKVEGVKVYEIGYLLVSSIPAEKVTENVSALKDIIIKKGAHVIAEGAPELRPLAYTMIKKIGTANVRFPEAYMGWIKFDLPTAEINAVKKSFEEHPNMLRCLVMTTVRENTYLGKMSPVFTRAEDIAAPVAEAPIADAVAVVAGEPAAAASSASDIDKQIDEMVK